MVNKKYFVQRNKCPLCASKNYKLIFSKTFKEIKSKNFFSNHLNNKFPLSLLKNANYNLSECLDCMVIFQNNILNKKYNSKYYNDYIDHNQVLEKNQKRVEQNQLIKEVNSIERMFKNKKIKILEFGAGFGTWISAVKKKNFKDITAIEISKKRRVYLKKKGIKVYADINNLKKNSFDFIYSDQTLEHLVYPGEKLKQIISLLKKDGILLIKIPSGFFLKSKLKKKYYAQNDEAIPLEHINIFTNKSLNYIKSFYNLKRLEISYYYKFYEFDYYKYLASDFYHRIFGKKILFKK